MTTPNANREERSDNQQQSAQNTPAMGSGGENHDTQTFSRASDSPSFAGQSGVRVLPIRTMVAAVPATFGRLPSDSSTNSLGLYYPMLGRVQHVASGHMSASQAPGEPLSVSTQPEQHPVSESTGQQQNAEGPNQDGNTLYRVQHGMMFNKFHMKLKLASFKILTASGHDFLSWSFVSIFAFIASTFVL